jgi:hypothetical protein
VKDEMEYWDVGVLAFFASHQYSSTPTLQYSNTPEQELYIDSPKNLRTLREMSEFSYKKYLPISYQAVLLLQGP